MAIPRRPRGIDKDRLMSINLGGAAAAPAAPAAPPAAATEAQPTTAEIEELSPAGSEPRSEAAEPLPPPAPLPSQDAMPVPKPAESAPAPMAQQPAPAAETSPPAENKPAEAQVNAPTKPTGQRKRREPIAARIAPVGFLTSAERKRALAAKFGHQDKPVSLRVRDSWWTWVNFIATEVDNSSSFTTWLQEQMTPRIMEVLAERFGVDITNEEEVREGIANLLRPQSDP